MVIKCIVTEDLQHFQKASVIKCSVQKIRNKSPKPSRTGIFPSLWLFCSQPPRKVKGIEQKLANVETNDFEKQVRKYIE